MMDWPVKLYQRRCVQYWRFYGKNNNINSNKNNEELAIKVKHDILVSLSSFYLSSINQFDMIEIGSSLLVGPYWIHTVTLVVQFVPITSIKSETPSHYLRCTIYLFSSAICLFFGFYSVLFYVYDDCTYSLSNSRPYCVYSSNLTNSSLFIHVLYENSITKMAFRWFCRRKLHSNRSSTLRKL